MVSPHPDVGIHPLDPTQQRFIVLASDGLWNVMTPQDVVDFVWEYEMATSKREDESRDVVRALIDEALYRWRKKGMFADNISVVIAFLSQDGVAGIESRVPPVEKGTCSLSQRSPNKEEEEKEIRKDSVPVMGSHVFASQSESTVCTEEGVLSGEDRPVPASLRCQCKDKQRTEEEGGEVERVGVKRLREETEGGETSSLTRPPLNKKSRQERDSGCESDSGSPVAETGDTLAPEDPSSGVFCEAESSPILLSSPPAPM